MHMGLRSRSARLDSLASHVELLHGAMLGPGLVELPNSIFGLDAESLQGQEHSAHSDDRRSSKPDMTTVEAPDSGRLDPTRDQGVLECSLELTSQRDDSLPGYPGSPGCP